MKWSQDQAMQALEEKETALCELNERHMKVGDVSSSRISAAMIDQLQDWHKAALLSEDLYLRQTVSIL